MNVCLTYKANFAVNFCCRCDVKFSRQSHLKRHQITHKVMKVDHQLKRPANDCIEPTAKKFKSVDAQSDDNAETNIGVCNWCGQNTNLFITQQKSFAASVLRRAVNVIIATAHSTRGKNNQY